MRMKFSVSIKCFSASTLLVLCVLLTGCGMSGSVGDSGGATPGGSSKVTIGINGNVHGGQNPILGGAIQLYQVGTTGYGSRAVPLIASSVTTDAGGGFNISGDYTCTSGTYLYITSSGGSPQVSTNPATNNNNITLAAALGLCDNLSASSFIVINEVTTVAAAYALAQFSQGTTFGQTMINQPGSTSSAPADNFATSSTNVTGLANAMAIAQVLANTATGTSPGNNSNSSAIPEWWQVNLIANMLATCVNSTGGTAGDGSTCGTLFGNVAGTAPADTLQAALDLALNPTLPSVNIANLYNPISSTAPFQPYPTSASAVTDFSVGISYTPLSGATKLLTQPQAVSIDSLGNAWVGNQPSSSPYHASLVELTPTGVPIQAGSASGNYTIGSYTVASNSTTYNPSQFRSNFEGLFAPAIDTNNNVWITDRADDNLAEITGSGTTFSPSYSYQNGGTSSASGYAALPASWPTSVYLDGSNNVWFTMTSGSNPPASCSSSTTGLSAAVFTSANSGVGTNSGIGVFLAESTSNVVVGKSSNALGNAEAAYITIDPGKNDTVTYGGGSHQISGSPFLWVLGDNSGTNELIPMFSQTVTGATASNNTPFSACPTQVTGIGQINSITTPSGWTADSSTPVGGTAHAGSYIYDEPNTALTNDYFHDYGAPDDQTWDNAGNLWIADGNKNNNYTTPIDTAGTINAAISKITPNWGAGTFSSGNNWYLPTSSSTENGPFAFSVFHAQSGLFDGSTVTNVPEYITTDGRGNVYFTMSTDNYVNAITNSGAALTQASGTANSPTTGFVGSTCTSCTFNGTKATYQRTNSYTLSRPTIDQSGNIWVPLQGSGSTSLYLLVGAAAPRVQPDSVGLANGTFATLP